MSDSKSVKAWLKECREQISNKDHKAAIKTCKRILNVEKDNYLALVFHGLCLHETGQNDMAKKVTKLG